MTWRRRRRGWRIAARRRGRDGVRGQRVSGAQLVNRMGAWPGRGTRRRNGRGGSQAAMYSPATKSASPRARHAMSAGGRPHDRDLQELEMEAGQHGQPQAHVGRGTPARAGRAEGCRMPQVELVEGCHCGDGQAGVEDVRGELPGAVEQQDAGEGCGKGGADQRRGEPGRVPSRAVEKRLEHAVEQAVVYGAGDAVQGGHGRCSWREMTMAAAAFGFRRARAGGRQSTGHTGQMKEPHPS